MKPQASLLGKLSLNIAGQLFSPASPIFSVENAAKN